MGSLAWKELAQQCKYEQRLSFTKHSYISYLNCKLKTLKTTFIKCSEASVVTQINAYVDEFSSVIQ